MSRRLGAFLIVLIPQGSILLKWKKKMYSYLTWVVGSHGRNMHYDIKYFKI